MDHGTEGLTGERLTQALTLTDEELMSRVRDAGDLDAFDTLYERYAQPAYRLALSICGDRQRSEDAVQDGFLSIWRGRARFRSERGTFKAWSLTAVRCAAIDTLRREGAAKRPPLANAKVDLPERGASPEDRSMAADSTATLRRALAQLPTNQAEVIGLAFFGELSHSEIARHLDLPRGTVKGRMRLGMEKLRTQLESQR